MRNMMNTGNCKVDSLHFLNHPQLRVCVRGVVTGTEVGGYKRKNAGKFSIFIKCKHLLTTIKIYRA